MIRPGHGPHRGVRRHFEIIEMPLRDLPHAKLIRDEIQRWSAVVKEQNIKVE